MALLNQPVQVSAQIPAFLETLRAGTAPTRFTREFLKDLGYKSSNHLQFIPLLKGLGFLTADGTPTDRYKQFLDGSRWKQVIAEAVKEAYGDIFILKAKPSNADLQMICGKFKSTYNLSDVSAERSARTFLALLNISDPDTLYSVNPTGAPVSEILAPAFTSAGAPDSAVKEHSPKNSNIDARFHYNIQIHLPPTKDIEVYNAIFKSLKEHLLD